MNVTIPNNPMKAFLLGKRQGTKDNMDMVAMTLIDKCCFHVKREVPDDTQSIDFLYRQLVSYAAEINEGRIKRKEIKDMLAEEAQIEFKDGDEAE